MTERDVVLRERAAFVAGAEYNFDALRERNRTSPRTTAMLDHAETKKEARRRYPLPKIIRTRVVVDDVCIHWRFVDGYLQWRGATGEWRRTQDYNMMAVSANRITLWADLLANPTEEVEDA